MENLVAQIDELKTKTLAQLQGQFEELWGKKADSPNEVFLQRKIAYRLQERALGGLSRNAKAKIAELIEKYDPVNNKTLRPKIITGGKEVKRLASSRDKRLPIPGTTIRKKYKGLDVEVLVLEKGFEYKDKFYKSLTSVARVVTGSNWNGYAFFDV